MKLIEPRDEADWWIKLRPLKFFGAPPILRMRRFLKAALRSYGFRAEHYYQDHQRVPQEYSEGAGI